MVVMTTNTGSWNSRSSLMPVILPYAPRRNRNIRLPTDARAGSLL
jgi:hypothetical protein